MIERVALHQTRFHAPGLAPDARGVAIGQKLAILFSSLDRLVGFFRIYSEQAQVYVLKVAPYRGKKKTARKK